MEPIKKEFFLQCAWAPWGLRSRRSLEKKIKPQWQPPTPQTPYSSSKSDAGDRILDMENELGKFIHDYLA